MPLRGGDLWAAAFLWISRFCFFELWTVRKRFPLCGPFDESRLKESAPSAERGLVCDPIRKANISEPLPHALPLLQVDRRTDVQCQRAVVRYGVHYERDDERHRGPRGSPWVRRGHPGEQVRAESHCESELNPPLDEYNKKT